MHVNWCFEDDEDVITAVFSAFVCLQGGSFTISLFTKLRAEKENLGDLQKGIKSKTEVYFFSAVVVAVAVVVS